MAAYIQDAEVLYLVFKLIADLLDNRSNRMRFDTWNVNGLIVFKEASSLMIKYMEYFDCLSPRVKAV
jgi:exportin-7